MGLIRAVRHGWGEFRNALIQREQPTVAARRNWIPVDTLITDDTALTYSALWAAVRVITETIGVLRWQVMDVVENGKTRHREDLPLDYLLSVQANPEMTAQVFRETLTAHTMLWGNGYAEIVPDMAGRPTELWPLMPHQVEPKRDASGQLYYEYRPTAGEALRLPPERVLHIKGLGYDGVCGYDVITYNARTIGQGIAAEDYSTAFYKNGAHISGALVGDKPLSEIARKEVREAFLDSHGGPKKSHGLLVLGNNYRYERFAVAPEAAQLIESRKFSVTEIARIFRIPPHMLGDLERATFSNIEHQSIEFAQHTIRPWVTRWEQEANIKLIARRNRRRLTTRMDIESLTRGDVKSRYEAYKIGREWGWLNANRILEMEGLDPIEGDAGDVYLIPMNFQNADKINEQPEPAPIPEPADEQEQAEQETANGQVDMLRPVILQAAKRINDRELNTLERKWHKFMPDVKEFAAAMRGWFDNQQEFARDIVAPVLEATGVVDETQALQLAALFAENYRIERETLWHLASDAGEFPAVPAGPQALAERLTDYILLQVMQWANAA